jgi:hypothetical protein
MLITLSCRHVREEKTLTSLIARFDLSKQSALNLCPQPLQCNSRYFFDAAMK